MEASGEFAGTAIALVARLYLGLFFLQSALGKIANLGRFIQGAVEYRVVPERVARVLGALLPWGELGLAGALLIGLALPLTGIVAALLLLCFTAAIAINLRRGRAIRCHCYGIADPPTIGWGTVGRNLLLLLLAVATTLAPPAAGAGWWLPRWDTDRLLLTSGGTALPLLLLLAFCITGILLLEWTIDIHSRVSQLRQR